MIDASTYDIAMWTYGMLGKDRVSTNKVFLQCEYECVASGYLWMPHCMDSEGR